jgi:penicillin-binding protein 2
MLVFDQLKKNDPHLRLVAMVLVGGLCILLAGLWWVQVVSAKDYQSHLETQAYRTIRIPAVRGKILDRESRVLAENRPRYNLSLYLDDLRKRFTVASDQMIKQARDWQKKAITAQEKKLGRSLTKAERKQFAFKPNQLEKVREQARAQVAAGVVADISRKMGEPLPFDAEKFTRHYKKQLAMPFSILPDLDDEQIARFQENFTNGVGADLELQSTRNYPFGTTAAHLLGFLKKDNDSLDGEEPFFNYRLTDYRGVTGIEGSFDSELHGRAGIESVLVNNLGYRQSEDVGSHPAPGNNVVLTIDLDLQRTAEQSLAGHQGANVNAAVVVMDVRTGDVLAMVSSPTYDPNAFAQGISHDAYQQIQDLSAEKNRATYENYAPGSIFKPVVSLAALEAGLDPEKLYTVLPDPENPGHGLYENGRLKKKDTAPPGKYNFKRAIERSSNSYFIQVGLETGIDRVVTLAKKFHFGEKNNLPTRQEARGDLPTLDRVHHAWRDGDTANLCIGQGELSVTPLQMAVAYSAIANGGTVLWPQLVSRIEPQNPSAGETATNFPSALVRDRIGVSMRSLRILHDAMLGETEDQVEGTGKAAVVPGLRICGKTGTAQVQDSANRLTGYNYWFASFAPYEKPKYAVVVMVQIPGTMVGSGGKTCAPIAHDIYEMILQKQNSSAPKVLATAK